MKTTDTVHVTLEIRTEGVSVVWEGETLTLPDEDLAAIRAEAQREAEDRNLDRLGVRLWSSTLGKLPLSAAGPVTLEIRAEEGDLATLPWETMIEPSAGLPAALHPGITPFRKPLRCRGFMTPAPPEPPPLRLVVVHPKWRADEEFTADFRSALEDPIQTTLDGLFLPTHDAVEVAGRLEGYRPHAVHWVLGGTLESGSLEEQLDLIETHFLAPERAPRLLVLTGPQGAGFPGMGSGGGLLSRLAGRGLEAVVVPSGNDLAPFAARFWTRFYEDLARAETLAGALRRGRNRLSLEASSSPAWAGLALYAVEPGVRLVQSRAEPRDGVHGSILAVRSELAVQPFKGLSSYEEEDGSAYFGRERQASEILEILRRERRLVLFGASGAGKTSLVRAGLLPLMRYEGWAPVYVTPSTILHSDVLAQLGVEPSTAPATAEDLLAAVDRVLAAKEGIVLPFVMDQAEDLLGHPERRKLLRGLLMSTRAEASHCVLLLVLRPDARLPLRGDLEAVYLDHPVRELEIAPFTPEMARSMVEQMERRYGFRCDEGLLDQILSDLYVQDGEGGPAVVLLPQLSLILRLLWERRQRFPSVVLLFDEYWEIEVGRLLPDQLRHVLELLGEADATAARRVLIHLVDPGSRRPQPISSADLANLTGFEAATVSRVLQALERRHLGRKLPDGRFQLVHEVLAQTVCAELLSPDAAEGEAVRWLIRAHLDRWRDRGDLLPPNVLARARRAAGHLVLAAPERALYLASLLLAGEDDPEGPPAGEDPLFAEVEGSPDLLEAVFEELRTSRNPKALALALQLCSLQGPVRRGFSPIQLAASPHNPDPQARFLSEALVAALAETALKTSLERGRNQSEQESKEALELLAETKLLRQPTAIAAEVNRERLVKILGGGPGGMFSSHHSRLAFWPGVWVGGASLFCMAVLLASPLSHALWPAGNQDLAGLEMVLLLLVGIFFASGQFVQDSSMLRVLNPALGVPSVAWTDIRSRLRPVFRTTAGALACAGVLVCCLHLIDRFSGWLHHSFFTAATVRELWTWGLSLPGSFVPGVVGAASGVQEFFLGVPLIGYALQWLASIPNGTSGLWWLLLTLASWGLGALVAAGLIPFLLGLVLVFPSLVLFPPAILIVTGCAEVDRTLFGSPDRRPFLRAAETLAASALVGLAFPWAMELSDLTLGWASSYVWRPDVFYGQGRLEALAEILQRLSWGVFPVAVGSALPLGICLAVRVLGCRSVRLALAPYTTWGTGRPREKELWPLWAEGTGESLRLFFKLVRKRASARGLDSFTAAWLVVAGDPQVPPAGRSDALAEEAEKALWLFDPCSWPGSWLSAIRELTGAATGNEARVERLQSFLRKLEESRAAAPSSSLPIQPKIRPRWVQILGKVFVLALGLLLWLFFLGLLLHFSRMIVTRLADLLFPLGSSLATSVSDLSGTFAWVVRLVEFMAFMGLFAVFVWGLSLLSRRKSSVVA